jgi:hypothetical protein
VVDDRSQDALKTSTEEKIPSRLELSVKVGGAAAAAGPCPCL